MCKYPCFCELWKRLSYKTASNICWDIRRIEIEAPGFKLNIFFIYSSNCKKVNLMSLASCKLQSCFKYECYDIRFLHVVFCTNEGLAFTIIPMKKIERISGKVTLVCKRFTNQFTKSSWPIKSIHLSYAPFFVELYMYIQRSSVQETAEPP